MWPAALLAILQNVLPDVLKRVLPEEKMSEADRTKIQADLTLQIMQQSQAQMESEFKDRSDARALAVQDIAKGNALTSFLSATVRPLWGFGAFAVVAWSVYQGTSIDSDIRDIIQTVLYFYFGGRTIEKVTPTIVDAFRKN